VKCRALLDPVRKTRTPDYAIRKPVAQVIPPSPDPASDWMGWMNRRIEILGGIVSRVNGPPLSF